MKAEEALRAEVDRLVDRMVDALLAENHPLVARLAQIDSLRRSGAYEEADDLARKVDLRYGLDQLRANVRKDAHQRLREWLVVYGQEDVPRATRQRWARGG